LFGTIVVPETPKQQRMFYSVQVSGTRQIWYQNARQISKVTGTRFWYHNLDGALGSYAMWLTVCVKMVNGFRYYRPRALLPFTHARSESTNADSLNSNFLQLGRRSGGRPQRTVHPMRLPVNTVIHTHTLVGLEPATFRSLVDCWSDVLPLVPLTHVLRSARKEL